LILKEANPIKKKFKRSLNRKYSKKRIKKEVVDKELALKCMVFLTKNKLLFQKLLKKPTKLRELFANY